MEQLVWTLGISAVLGIVFLIGMNPSLVVGMLPAIFKKDKRACIDGHYKVAPEDEEPVVEEGEEILFLFNYEKKSDESDPHNSPLYSLGKKPNSPLEGALSAPEPKSGLDSY